MLLGLYSKFSVVRLKKCRKVPCQRSDFYRHCSSLVADIFSCRTFPDKEQNVVQLYQTAGKESVRETVFLIMCPIPRGAIITEGKELNFG